MRATAAPSSAVANLIMDERYRAHRHASTQSRASMVLKSSMQLDQLVAFDRIAREGTFSRAAMALGLGQPAVSARILALEDAVGGTLFVRGRTLRLTALGESFLPFARRALEVLPEGVEASRLAQIGERGSVRIGVLGSF